MRTLRSTVDFAVAGRPRTGRPEAEVARADCPALVSPLPRDPCLLARWSGQATWCRSGEFAGNHVFTPREGVDHLAELGRLVLGREAQPVSYAWADA